MEETKKSDLFRHLFLLATLSILGATLLMVSMRWGVGLSPDSAVYIAAARNLLTSEGLNAFSDPGELAPLTHYPPLYSILLAGWRIFGVDPMEGARWLSALVFAANIAMVGLILYTSTHSLWPLVFGAILMIDSLPMIQLHSMAWSEPVFIFFVLLSLFLLTLYIDRPARWPLVAASLAVALGFLTRYAGLALVATGVLVILTQGRIEWKHRLKDAAILSALSCLPIAIWVIRNISVSGSAINRRLAFHPPGVGHFQAALDTLSAWLLPARVAPMWVSPILVGCLFVLVLAAVLGELRQVRKEQSEGSSQLRWLITCFLASYVFLLIIFVSLLDAHTPIDNRILSPAYVGLLILVVSLGVCSFLNLALKNVFRSALIVLVLGFSTFQLTEVIDSVSHSYREGIGYAAQPWRESPLIRHLRGWDASGSIFSNAPDAIYLLSGHPAVMIPRKVNTATHHMNANYLDDLEFVRNRLQVHNGLLVYFSGVRWRWYLPSEQELKKTLGLRLILQEEDGSIYR